MLSKKLFKESKTVRKEFDIKKGNVTKEYNDSVMQTNSSLFKKILRIFVQNRYKIINFR